MQQGVDPAGEVSEGVNKLDSAMLRAAKSVLGFLPLKRFYKSQRFLLSRSVSHSRKVGYVHVARFGERLRTMRTSNAEFIIVD